MGSNNSHSERSVAQQDTSENIPANTDATSAAERCLSEVQDCRMQLSFSKSSNSADSQMNAENAVLDFASGKVDYGAESNAQTSGKEPAEKLGPLGTKMELYDSPGESQSTIASVYSDPQDTASGRRFNPNEYTVAHKTLPLGTVLRISNPKTAQEVDAVVSDRGPYVKGRGLDLSTRVGNAIGIHEFGNGIGKVDYQVIGKEPDFRKAPRDRT